MAFECRSGVAVLRERAGRVPSKHSTIAAIVRLHPNALPRCDIRQPTDSLGADKVLPTLRRPRDPEVMPFVHLTDRDASAVVDEGRLPLLPNEGNPDVSSPRVDRILEVLPHQCESLVRVEGVENR